MTPGAWDDRQKKDRCVYLILTQILRNKDRNGMDHSLILGPDKKGHFKREWVALLSLSFWCPVMVGCVALPPGAMGLSAVCNCGIF